MGEINLNGLGSFEMSIGEKVFRDVDDMRIIVRGNNAYDKTDGVVLSCEQDFIFQSKEQWQQFSNEIEEMFS